jgi:predicted kinase
VLGSKQAEMAKPDASLIAFAGLPGTGKTTLAKELATHLGAVYLRIDTIEQAIRDSGQGVPSVNEEGYRVAYAVAEENLRLGSIVVTDSVNALQEVRNAWKAIAFRAHAKLLEVEVICTNPTLHEQRVQTRDSDIPTLKLPNWNQVLTREYQPWNRDHIVIDTAGRGVRDCLKDLLCSIETHPPQ